MSDDIRRGQNPIQAAIDVLSFPQGWRLQQITYLPFKDRIGVVAIYAPTDPELFITIAGIGNTADEALRDAQKRVWAQGEKHK